MNLIEMTAINRFFGKGENRVHILKDINLSIKKGDFIAIIGQSGSGKSTLMNILGCLDTPDTGSYRINGVETAQMNANELATLRRKRFGFIFQKYNLLSSLNARDNVALPAVYAGIDKLHRNQRAEELLAKLGLAGKENNTPNELSGGQQQRVSIARALMNGGEIILADEPTGALDSGSGEIVMQILGELHKQGHTIIMVTHDANIAAHANRIVKIHDGKIISDTSQKPIISIPDAEPPSETRSWVLVKDQLIESFKMSVQSIFTHKLRSLLTMLGIIIGIASVVSVVALGQGSQDKILQNISEIGTNTISIYPGSGFGDRRSFRIRTLTVADANILSKQNYVDSATPVGSTSGTLTFNNQALTAQVFGAGPQYFTVRGLKLAQGRFFDDYDVQTGTQVVVIDHNIANKLFKETNAIGKTILFNKRPLTIVGVTKKNTSGMGNIENLEMWIPYTAMMNRITGERHIRSIVVKVADKVNTQAAEQSIIDLLTTRHGKKDFFTSNSDSIRKAVEQTTNTMTLLISSIAVISLIVGGIGVMNIMLVSVTERTKEIGIRMAIGARQSNILQQFLIEAILICLIGGLSGIAVSVIISTLFNYFSSEFFSMSFSGLSIVMAVLCSSAIGILFGFIPARNASKLNPIDALAHD